MGNDATQAGFLARVVVGAALVAALATSATAVPVAARDVAIRLGRSPNFLIGMGNDLASDHNQDGAYTLGTTLDLHYAYLVGLQGQGGWPDWNAGGTFVNILADSANAHGVVPMFTLYGMAAWGEGNLSVLTNDSYMGPYWSGARLLFQRLAVFNKPAVVHLEPDFWGFAQTQNGNPAAIAVRVKAHAPECADLPDNLTGLGKCLVRMARTISPKVVTGFHVSPWSGTTAATVAYMNAIGAGQADITVIETLDRDAGCFEAGTDPNCQRSGTFYWDESNTTSPNFHEHTTWARALYDGIGLPILWWQMPFGVPSSTRGGSPGHYRDNRVHYVFSHVSEFVAAGGLGAAWGVGAGNQTYIDSDGNQFKNAVAAYFAHPTPLPGGGPSLSIGDVSVTEGNGGTTNAVFTVSLSVASATAVTVGYATAGGTATSGGDFTATSGTLTLAAGALTGTITVPVVADLLDEPNEAFTVTLSSASGATIADAQAVGTIVDDDPVPTLSIDNVSVTEGNAGTKAATFTVSLSAASGQAVGVTAATANGTASAGSDYTAGTWPLTFAAGVTTRSVAVSVLGDGVYEADETFVVNLTGATGATLADAQGVGTIVNDDLAGFSIGDVDVVEPASGTRNAAFTVTLAPTVGTSTSVSYATTGLTATTGTDFTAASGTLTFGAGVASQTINVAVLADAAKEGTETFRVTLSNATGAAIAQGQATGRIHDPGNFFTVTPCRVLDTRNATGAYGGPALATGQSRTFTLRGVCGVPATAKAVAANLTVTGATAAGNLRAFPSDVALPTATVLNYRAAQTRANDAIVGLGATGAVTLRVTQASGSAHVILDVAGYFE